MTDESAGSLPETDGAGLGVADALSTPLFVCDADDRLRNWNPAMRDVAGRDDEELTAAVASDFVAERDAERVRRAVAAAREGGHATVVVSIPPADGRVYELRLDLADDDECGAVVGLVVDVTEERRQREALEDRMRVLREMYEIIADRDRPFDAQVEALLALGRTELGTAYGTLSEIRGEEYLFEVVDAEDDRIQSGDVVPLSATNCEIAASTEETLVLGDVARDAPAETDRAGYAEWGISCYLGAPVFVDDEVYGTFCFYDTEPRGEFSEWEVTLVDLMSRWVSYELGRQRANERLQRQNEQLDQFAAIVSHDLRNPLNVLHGSLTLAEETGEATHFERCLRTVERMEALIDDLLTLARAGERITDPERVSLPAVLEDCWLAVDTADATLAVETDRTIRADEGRLKQLFENLFRNSVEHGGAGLTVTVGDLEDASGIYVEDDGRGIPEDDAGRVFESGFSTAEGGTGFGLHIVDRIAQAHGWTVRLAESAEGGARFEFTGIEA